MPETVTLSTLVPAPPDIVYQAWLDSEDHAAFTGGGEAFIDPRVGGRHKAWDGYISGVILELLPGSKIVQSWRTTEFPEGAADSRLEVHLSIAGGATRLTLVHSDLPEGQARALEKGWEEYYFSPMRDWFGAKAAARAAAHAGLPPPGTPAPKPAGKPGSTAKATARKPAPAKAAVKAAAKVAAAKKAPAKNAAKAKPVAKKAAPKKAAPKKAAPKKAKPAATSAKPAAKKVKPAAKKVKPAVKKGKPAVKKGKVMKR